MCVGGAGCVWAGRSWAVCFSGLGLGVCVGCVWLVPVFLWVGTCRPNDAVSASYDAVSASYDAILASSEKRQNGTYVFQASVTSFAMLRPKMHAERSASIVTIANGVQQSVAHDPCSASATRRRPLS